MAVVIQEMVDAESAGVIFSQSPIDGDPSKIVITANFGLGETVVSAKSDPDTIIVENQFWNNLSKLNNQIVDLKNPNLRILDKKCGMKSKKLVMNENETIEMDVDPNDSENMSINDEMILKLAKIALELEEAFGTPRDIEFAINQVSMASIFFAFYFLQKFFAKLVFFANKKQKKKQKKFSNIYNHTSSPKLQ